MPKGYMGNGYFEFSGVLIFNSMEGESMNIRAQPTRYPSIALKPATRTSIKQWCLA